MLADSNHYNYIAASCTTTRPTARGHIETKDRFGIQRRFPVMSVSIAAISIARARSYAALAELAAVGKRAAKDIPGSTYVRDGQTLFADANAIAGGPAPAATG